MSRTSVIDASANAAALQRVLLRVAYDGTPFHGFAESKEVPTVGGELRRALEQVLGEPIELTCAGRTDAGVHALDQVVSFATTAPCDPERLRISLNGLCKPYIVVAKVAIVPDDFNARFSCIKRAYRYRILNTDLPDPFRRQVTWFLRHPLNLDAMRAGARHLIGSHDFTSLCRRQFQTRGGESVELSRVRTVYRADWVRVGDEVHLEIEASAFCQQMVRSITGMCADIGRGRIAAHQVPEILAAGDRKAAGRVAPPQGLFLVRCSYPAQALSLGPRG